MSDLDAVAALVRSSCRCVPPFGPTSRPPGRNRKQADPRRPVSAKKYFALACRLIRPCSPVLVGSAAVGHRQSHSCATLAPELAPAPGAIVLRSDVERKCDARTPRGRASAAASIRPESTHASTPMLVEKAGASSPGSSPIVDAVFRSATGARRVAKRWRKPAASRFTGCSHGRYGDPRGAGRVASGTCLGCRRSRRAGPGR